MADIAQLLGRMGGGGGGGMPPGASMGGNVVAGPGMQGGGGPPGLGAARGNIGAVTKPQPAAGNIHAATEKIKAAVKMLEESLPLIPMGMPLHTELMQTTSKLLKHLSDTASNPGTELQTLINAARQRAQSAPQNALGRMMQPPAMPAPAGGEGGGAPPGGGGEPGSMAA